jgi:hypothetical protein
MPSWFGRGISLREPRYEEVKNRRHCIDHAQTKAWLALVEDFRMRLVRGDLVATAIVAPERLNSLRKVIPSERWRTLRVNFVASTAAGPKSTATGERLELFGVLVQVNKATSPSRSTGPGRTLLDSSNIPSKRPVGRPSVLDRIRAEWRRRKDAGQLTDSKAADARALRQWAVEHLEGQHDLIPEWESIARRIRDLYLRSDPDK